MPRNDDSGPERAAGRCVVFGEVLLRLSAPDRGLLLQRPGLDSCFGGAEANVAAGLASLGRPTAIVTALPGNRLGQAALAALRGMGIDCSGVHQSPGRMGLYFLDSGAGLRPGRVIYDRDDSSFARMDPDRLDWPMLLRGAGRLHLSGITPALGDGPAIAARRAAATAVQLGIPVSFDVNFRPSLWRTPEAAPPLLRALTSEADVLFANGHDMALLADEAFDGHPEDEQRLLASTFAKFPKLKVIASSRRVMSAADRLSVSVKVDGRDAVAISPERTLSNIVDRIGTGDALAAGVLAGLGPSHDIARAADWGLALFCLKHGIPGDVSFADMSHVEAFLDGRLDIQR
ncbi:sugar kinase [Sphingomonas histidinilytica]|uniref:2-dehydro-3-deoxygluconokinase n=1 Tax=Rhizorhabdus histidinilytica TaxID=439228 RepID=A0A1T5GA65_9SPHN|nr:sugar kinase [Rhizorhabdus histidinilytica]MBO9379906.1 sugar kinase [Rhizorhabdus histidinilytica]QEH77123.1 sugar kinase [Sphingomonas sp. C8-2]SKC05350.1 2-dehydro-3-deoxygluconokinase [Rhizorhabdus histidinilytica]